LTYCDSCGANFHHSCIKEWKTRTADAEVTKCPLCRQAWIDQRENRTWQSKSMDENAFETYYEWLYNGHLAADDQENGVKPVVKTLPLLKTYVLGMKLEDWRLCDTVLEAIVEHSTKTKWHPGPVHVEYVYKKTPGPCRLRRFVVGLFMHLPRADWLGIRQQGTGYPLEFLQDVVAALWLKDPPAAGAWNEATLKADLCTPREHVA
jgi:Zn-finger nucleic acid-binding protein